MLSQKSLNTMNKQQIFQYIARSYADARRFTASYSGPENPFVPYVGKKIAISWSGGKDSCYTLLKAKELWLDVKYLFNLTNPEETISLTWAYNLDIIKEQARQLNIPLLTIPSIGKPEHIFSELCDFFVKEWIESIGAGHYLPTGQREFFQKLLYPRWMSLFEPNLWKNKKSHIEEIIQLGIVQKIVLVKEEEISSSFLWKTLDQNFLEYLDKIPNFQDFAWEISTYQTIVVDCPYFEKKLEFSDFYDFKVWDYRIHYYF